MTNKAISGGLNFFAAFAFTIPLISSAQAGSVYHVLHYFYNEPASHPGAALVADAQGNLYGTAEHSGDGSCGGDGCGAVFKLIRDAAQKWHTSVIHSFTGPDGANPMGSLIFDSSGNLYGTTSSGGANDFGVVFELLPSGTTWDEKVLYSFGLPPDANLPTAALIFDAEGNLYGTGAGGSANGGAAFKLQRSGNGWNELVIYSFPNDPIAPGGSAPTGNLVLDSAGNLYGVTVQGGKNGVGIVYELTPSFGGNWTETVLHQFTNGADGGSPMAGLILDSAGNLYGTTAQGGDLSGSCQSPNHGCGTVFELKPSTGDWIFSVLHAFTGFATTPFSGLALDAAGNLYGTTWSGANNKGVAFELSHSSHGWIYTLLHGFAPQSGANPLAAPILCQGVLYGTTYYGGVGQSGGVGGYGVVFSLTP